jgi:aryl-phospho-beta-D-glucosidase BglC (GH1 family)
MSDGGVTSGSGYLHTNGAKIVDANGNTVRLTGISWFGMETNWFAPHGLDQQPMSFLMDTIKQLGYNLVRVPFCTQMFDSGSTPMYIDYTKNPALQGLTPIQILDQIIAEAQARNLRIILDRHRPDDNSQSALWYTSQYSEQRWISDWQMLATRYLGNSTVVGFDLHNEPSNPATWGDNSMTTDWRAAAERAGNAIQTVNPNLLIIVEGIEEVNGDYYWNGGNLMAAGMSPVQLTVPNQVVYSPHDYPASVYAQPWFSAANYPSNLPGVWDMYWGYLVEQNVAPIWIGEFGSLYQTTSDQQWMGSLVNYIIEHQLSFSYWCLNPDSSDTGGILQNDWMTVNTNKQTVVQPALAN